MLRKQNFVHQHEKEVVCISVVCGAQDMANRGGSGKVLESLSILALKLAMFVRADAPSPT